MGQEYQSYVTRMNQQRVLAVQQYIAQGSYSQAWNEIGHSRFMLGNVHRVEPSDDFASLEHQIWDNYVVEQMRWISDDLKPISDGLCSTLTIVDITIEHLERDAERLNKKLPAQYFLLKEKAINAMIGEDLQRARKEWSTDIYFARVLVNNAEFKAKKYSRRVPAEVYRLKKKLQERGIDPEIQREVPGDLDIFDDSDDDIDFLF
ncbi:hypothetical protein KY328_06075 [Candidatus Woesearchaeota archaeon]|nr:hypothetical protein [Candidatus Woesearchaeota archaeon]MBW3022468.1 hypothetical protein [Candidatus Woesearchaeota archaeon]